MSQPFYEYFLEGIETGECFAAEDVLATLLPLFQQVRASHERGEVAPLEGLNALQVDFNTAWYAESDSLTPRRNPTALRRFRDQDRSRAFEVVQRLREESGLHDADLAADEDEVVKAQYLPGYLCWEHIQENHDPLTDIFSLGQLLASMALGLDFTNAEELERFSLNRGNLFRLQPNLHPVIARILLGMTELDRRSRLQDLGTIIQALEHYRSQPGSAVELDHLPGMESSKPTDRRGVILTHLRDRLFEFSKRNRLLHYRSTLQSINLSEASVPVSLDVENISPARLFIWSDAFRKAIVNQDPVELGDTIDPRDVPYAPHVLNKIRLQDQRDRREVGYASLRLVICFFRWHNLKEEAATRIHSPLLLLPVELKKLSGVKDRFTLFPTSGEAEVNPALRQYLFQLYGIELPETVDLSKTSMAELHRWLEATIQSTEPGVRLQFIDKPRLDLLQRQAKKRLELHRRRRRISGRGVRQHGDIDYSYNKSNYRPLGLQLFVHRIKPPVSPLRREILPDEAGPRQLDFMVAPKKEETEPADHPDDQGTTVQTYHLKEGSGENNPYEWDFDLCAQTLGIFHYRKMTLVRDYQQILTDPQPHPAFDDVFSIAPKPYPPRLDPPPMSERHLVVPADATQLEAIQRARLGASFIIQGPPGTGKSQTITNLIADFLARGKRVLFVCEKRAAIDVVHHRLKQQGLANMCSVIHDSQADKKAFVMDLKEEYERLSETEADPGPEQECAERVQSIETELRRLQRVWDTTVDQDLATHQQRLVALRDHIPELTAAEWEQVPGAEVWREHGDRISLFCDDLDQAGLEACPARLPFVWLAPDILDHDQPVTETHARGEGVQARLQTLRSRLEALALPAVCTESLEALRATFDLAADLNPLANLGLADLLDADSPNRAVFEKHAQLIRRQERRLAEAREHNVHWRKKFSSGDTENALSQARVLEGRITRFLSPRFWSLRKVIQQAYDFSAHAVAPTWTQVLERLQAEHQQEAEVVYELRELRDALKVEDARLVYDSLVTLETQQEDWSEREQTVAGLPDDSLLELHEVRKEVMRTLDQVQGLIDLDGDLDFDSAARVTEDILASVDDLATWLPALRDFRTWPDGLRRMARLKQWRREEIEAALRMKSVRQAGLDNRAFGRFTYAEFTKQLSHIQLAYSGWLDANAARIRERRAADFRDHLRICSLPAAKLKPEQKPFKRDYNRGRRVLENEFGKKMRYKAIRDLAAGDSGLVVRDLKPVWLMSPLSVADTLPIAPDYFDVVIFDEASQVPVEDAVPCLYRSQQVIVVGDEMQLPPTRFFSGAQDDDELLEFEEEDEVIQVDLNMDSFLAQSAKHLPPSMLQWHYRSRYEPLISFCNHAFYQGALKTIPDRKQSKSVGAIDAGTVSASDILDRSISFHYLPKAVYEHRRNMDEAEHLVRLLRLCMMEAPERTLGIVAFSEAQQRAIEQALETAAEKDPELARRLLDEEDREEDGHFSGLFVKNLENVQGDERDIMFLSICYGYDAQRKMRMNFGPINQAGGEKRLNVIFSRAKHHLVIVSSIRGPDITNTWNEGANTLRNYLVYAQAQSEGQTTTAKSVLRSLAPAQSRALPDWAESPVLREIKAALASRGYEADIGVGQSTFRIPLGVREKGTSDYLLGVFVDLPELYGSGDPLEVFYLRPEVLRAFGWKIEWVLQADWLRDPEVEVERLLASGGVGK